jgi:hypothetical protein
MKYLKKYLMISSVILHLVLVLSLFWAIPFITESMNIGEEWVKSMNTSESGVCPKFSSIMRTIAFIEDSDVIKKILKHQNHWNLKRKPRPTANIPPIDVVATNDDLPEPSVDGYITDPNYSAEAYFKTTIEQ